MNEASEIARLQICLKTAEEEKKQLSKQIEELNHQVMIAVSKYIDLQGEFEAVLRERMS